MVLPDPPICLITSETAAPGRIESTVEAALAGGIRWIQLRRRRDTGRCLYELALRLKSAADAYGATLVINDRIDIALACHADGVHLPASGMPPATAGRLLESGSRCCTLLGRSVHSSTEINDPVNSPLDYFQFGPVFDTPSKRAFGKPQGMPGLNDAIRVAGDRRVVAVGGIGRDQASELARSGVAGIAMIGAFAAAEDPERAAHDLIAAFRPA